MKSIIIIFLSFLYAQNTVSQVEWAPVGAKWWQIVEIAIINYTTEVNTFECTSAVDTLGHHCKLIYYSTYGGGTATFITYQDGDKVYNYDPSTNDFYLEFDYSKNPGEEYTIYGGSDTITCHIDSIGWKIINDDSIKLQYANIKSTSMPQSTEYTTIYEGIGTSEGIFLPRPTGLTLETWWWLSCYEKPDGEVYAINEFQNYSCQSLATSAKQIEPEKGNVLLFPNPASLELTITSHNLTTKPHNLFLFDATGKFVKLFKWVEGQEVQIFSLENMSNGLYFWTLKDEEDLIGSGKLVITK